MTQKGHGVIRVHCDLHYDPKVTVTVVVSLAWFITQKPHGVFRGRPDLLHDPKGNGDLCSRFDLFYDLKRSRGGLMSP